MMVMVMVEMVLVTLAVLTTKVEVRLGDSEMMAM